MRFLKAFVYAFRGVGVCICRERNLRIHTVAALYVLVFSFFFELSAVHYALLFLAVGFVLAMEIVNTAIEKAADEICLDEHPGVRVIKDVAAGAVLVAALTAAAVGTVIFWQPEGFVRLYGFFAVQPWWLAVLAAGTALCVFYIVKGGPGRLRHKPRTPHAGGGFKRKLWKK